MLSHRIHQINLIALFGIILIGFAAPNVRAQQPLKIGFVELSEVFDKGAKFKQTRNELKQILGEKRDKLQQLARNFLEDREKFVLQQELLPADTARERAQNLKERGDQLKELEMTEQVDFEKIKQEKIDPLIKEIITVVEAVAKDEGYTMVLHKSSLLYGHPQFDLTAKVIERINKN